MVTYADLRFIEDNDPQSESGYIGVKRTKNSYRSKIFGHVTSNAVPSAIIAAKRMVEWMKSVYGDDWKDYFNNRSVRPWTLVPIGSKFQIKVYLWGIPHIIGPNHKSKSVAMKWFRKWKENRSTLWGIDTEMRCASPLKP